MTLETMASSHDLNSLEKCSSWQGGGEEEDLGFLWEIMGMTTRPPAEGAPSPMVLGVQEWIERQLLHSYRMRSSRLFPPVSMLKTKGYGVGSVSWENHSSPFCGTFPDCVCFSRRPFLAP